MHWFDLFYSNENEALAQLYREQRPSLVSMLMNKFNVSKDEATEIFQTSVIVLYDNIKTKKITKSDVSDINKYLFGISKLKGYEHLRVSSKRNFVDLSDFFKSYVFEEVENDQNTNLIDQMNHVIMKLGSPCSEIITLFYYEKLNLEAITAKLNYKNTDTTKAMKHKCLLRIRNLLIETDDEKF